MLSAVAEGEGVSFMLRIALLKAAMEVEDRARLLGEPAAQVFSFLVVSVHWRQAEIHLYSPVFATVGYSLKIESLLIPTEFRRDLFLVKSLQDAWLLKAATEECRQCFGASFGSLALACWPCLCNLGG